MKNIVFLVFLLNSFAFSYDSPNPATDKLTLTGTIANTCLASIDHPINTYFYQDSNHATCLKYTSTIYTSTLCPDGKKYNKYSYSVYLNYPSCPSGQEIINGVCAAPPTCATGTLWNSLTDTCEYDPNTADGDGNGIPNKCDPDYVDYLTMDCDSNGIPNATDPDIDGDGILNGADPDPYVNGSASGTPDTPCPSSSYSFLEGSTQSVCSLDNPIFIAPDYEIQYVSNVYWDSCRNKCGFKKLYCPSGKAIKNGVCTSIEPDEGDCLGTKDCSISGISSDDSSANSYCSKRCYCLTTQFPIRSPDNLYFEKEVSCTENIGDTDTLGNLRDSSDINRTLPSDLLKDSNATASLDVSASMKVALDAYAGAKEATQLDLLSESKIQSLQLVSANTNLKNIESALENFSATSTSNQGVINGSLLGIKGGIDTSNGLLGQLVDGQTEGNTLLEDIKGLLDDSNSTIEDSNTSGSYVVPDGLDEYKSSLESLYFDFTNFSDNLFADFESMKVMLDGGLTSPTISSGCSPSFSTVVFGRTLVIDLCLTFSVFYEILYFIFSIFFSYLGLKIFFIAFKLRL